MKVLVVGSGGREHALCSSISKSPLLTKLWCAPGNPGIGAVAECVPIKQHQIRNLVNFANVHQIDLVVCGPEGPLVDGLSDALAVFSIPCCGPSKAAAQMEGSKTFTKILCDEAGIETAAWKSFTTPGEAIAYVQEVGVPIVIKADGLAGGKGVVVARYLDKAISAIMAAFQDHKTVVIEECLEGPEMSLFALCNGTDAVPLGTAQDYKRLTSDEDSPNTGGMGAMSPSPTFETDDLAWLRMVMPALNAMRDRGTNFRGILYAGVMLTKNGPRLIEYNVRFGDPECQAILLRLKSDLLPALYAAATGAPLAPLEFSDERSVTVVMAAPGYPQAPQKGSVIDGLDLVKLITNAVVFHSGTEIVNDKLIASGGRVLSVSATGETFDHARGTVYKAIDVIDWPESQYRCDIGLT